MAVGRTDRGESNVTEREIERCAGRHDTLVCMIVYVLILLFNNY